MKNTIYFLLFFCFINSAYCEDLQEMIEKATINGEIHLDKKTYVLNKPLKIPSGFKVYGNGARLEPSENWRSYNENYLPLIELIDVSDVYISDLTIDNMARRGIQGMPSYSILIMNSSFITIKNNEFKDLGLRKDDKSKHGSPFILVAAQEKVGDFSYIPHKHKNKQGSVKNIEILDNKFKNEEYVSSFAIRFVTLWTQNRRKESLSSRIADVLVKGNSFYGEYEWNTLEMAGPSTIKFTIEGNFFNGKSINNIDVDKGASDIIIKNNLMENLGLPFIHRNRNDVRVSPIMVHGNSNGYECENIHISGNVINGVNNPNVVNSRFLYSSGIGVLHAKNVVIEKNKIKNVFVGKKYGAGISLDQSVVDVNIKENLIEKCYRGIIITPNTRKINNILIEKNDISVIAEPLMVLSSKQGEFANVILNKNEFYSLSKKRIILSKNISGIVSDVK